MTELNYLLAQPFLLSTTSSLYQQCGGLVSKLSAHDLSKAEIAETLAQSQGEMRTAAHTYFDDVMNAARNTGFKHLWPYQVWLPLVSECIHHLLLVGETGSGKSYLAKVILCVRSWFGRVVVLDPHAVQPNATNLGDWGVASVGAGRKYLEISARMESLLAELSRRYEQRSNGVQGFEYLNIFIDEWPSIKAHCPDASAFMKTMSREGRKVGMRLVILTQSPQVESLGLRGEGDTKENFSIIFLGKYSKKHLPEHWHAMPRVGWLQHQDTGYPISTDKLQWLTERWLDLATLHAPPVWTEPEIEITREERGSNVIRFGTK